MKSTTLRSLKIAAIATCIISSNLSASMNSSAVQVRGLQLPTDTVSYSKAKLGNINLFHSEEFGFFVRKDGKDFQVKPECMDSELMDLSNEDLAFLLGLMSKVVINGKELTLVRMSPELTNKLVAEGKNETQLSQEDAEEILSQLPVGSYIKVFQYNDGEYGLHLEQRLLGGGVFGGTVGFLIGKGLVYGVTYVPLFFACKGIDLVAPGVGTTINIVGGRMISPFVEVASNKVGFALGVTGMLATGPA